jgi:hypothetical protein
VLDLSEGVSEPHLAEIIASPGLPPIGSINTIKLNSKAIYFKYSSE